jgi:7-carboxy-7-deazaguanine synthase
MLVTPKDQEAFNEGQFLPLVEDFYTIQGEGHQVGKPAYFIRIGGCDVGCSWCDTRVSWNPAIHPQVAIETIVKRAEGYPAKAVVVTGGEPLMYNLTKLTSNLRERKIKLFLETSGAYPLSGVWDWICLSPKKTLPPTKGIYRFAHELKVIITDTSDFIWAEENALKVTNGCLLYLQPEWSRYQSIIGEIVEYAKSNPKWNISIQAHKFMRIP